MKTLREMHADVMKTAKQIETEGDRVLDLKPGDWLWNHYQGEITRVTQVLLREHHVTLWLGERDVLTYPSDAVVWKVDWYAQEFEPVEGVHDFWRFEDFSLMATPRGRYVCFYQGDPMVICESFDEALRWLR